MNWEDFDFVPNDFTTGATTGATYPDTDYLRTNENGEWIRESGIAPKSTFCIAIDRCVNDKFEMSNQQCSDVNHCERGTHDCDAGLECIYNGDSEYSCSCASGYDVACAHEQPVVYDYELIKENGECPGQVFITEVDYQLVTMQECFALGESFQNGPCAERIVEWGNSGTFDPDGTGYCLCYPDICTEADHFGDGGEHILSFGTATPTECTQDACIDINECDVANECDTLGGSCVNTVGSFECDYEYNCGDRVFKFAWSNQRNFVEAEHFCRRVENSFGSNITRGY